MIIFTVYKYNDHIVLQSILLLIFKQICYGKRILTIQVEYFIVRNIKLQKDFFLQFTS